MSEENIEIVRRVYKSWARGDFSKGDPYDPDVEFEMPDWPEGASARGVEEMSRTWFQALNAWEGFRSEPQEFIAHGPHVLVRNNITARGRESGGGLARDDARPRRRLRRSAGTRGERHDREVQKRAPHPAATLAELY